MNCNVKSGLTVVLKAVGGAIANYKFTSPSYCLSVAEVIKAVHCLQHQSSVTGNYDKTPPGIWASQVLYGLASYISGYEKALRHWNDEVVGQKSIARWTRHQSAIR